jgi:hypothetical protein
MNAKGRSQRFRLRFLSPRLEDEIDRRPKFAWCSPVSGAGGVSSTQYNVREHFSLVVTS